MILKRTIPILIVLIAILSACSSLKKAEPTTAEEAFNAGLTAFNKGNYLEAQTYFDMIKLQYPASNYADDAQYYIAEINFKQKEYVVATFNYNRLRSVYPTSEHAKISMYKAGYSQYLLSPKYDRDQDYTKKAIKTFQEFQYTYPEKDSLYNNASKFIQELRNKLCEKDYRIAELYDKLDSPHAALIYYNIVINDFDDTDFFEPAIFGKIKSLMLIRKYDEANAAISSYDKLFPNGKYKEQIITLQQH